MEVEPTQQQQEQEEEEQLQKELKHKEVKEIKQQEQQEHQQNQKEEQNDKQVKKETNGVNQQQQEVDISVEESKEDGKVYQYKVGETVMTMWEKTVYEAKIMKVRWRAEDDTPEYLIHYPGWRKSYDSWKTEKQISKKIPSVEKLKHRSSSSSEDTSNQSEAKRPKIDRGLTVCQEYNLFSPKLRFQLVKDYQLVSEENMVVNLPSETPVTKILQKFEETQQDKQYSHFSASKLAEDLKKCFAGLIAAMLLYRGEREQYKTILSIVSGTEIAPQNSKITAGMELADIYGAEHFLRFLVKLPEMIALSELSVEEHVSVKALLVELLEYIGGEDGDSLFCNQYISSTSWN